MIRTLIKIGIWCSFLLIIVLALTWSVDSWVKRSAEQQVYNDIGKVPYNRVGMLLGTAKYLRGGRINLYYKYRIEAAGKLYKANKIDYVLVSGDNSTKSYDEPTTIKNDLIKMGIPADKIYLDYAGFRTLDSVVRSQKIFGQNKLTVISQRFHNERAIFISQFKNMEMIGFNAKDVSKHYGFKVKVREKLARVKMILDLVFGKQPHFLGEKIEIK